MWIPLTLWIPPLADLTVTVNTASGWHLCVLSLYTTPSSRIIFNMDSIVTVNFAFGCSNCNCESACCQGCSVNSASGCSSSDCEYRLRLAGVYSLFIPRPPPSLYSIWNSLWLWIPPAARAVLWIPPLAAVALTVNTASGWQVCTLSLYHALLPHYIQYGVGVTG
jgi:hypothetical protein